MIQGTPRRVAVSSKKVGELVFDKIFPAMQGEATDAMVLSLICAAALAMRPEIPHEQLQRAIMETSSYLIAQIAEPVAAGDFN